MYIGKVNTFLYIVKPKVKTNLTNKIQKEKDGRLRARYYYDTYGMDKTIGDRCNTKKMVTIAVS